MAVRSSNTNPSLIVSLARTRTQIFEKAEAEGDRLLSFAEREHADALICTIANSPAGNRREATIQVGIALEKLEACICGEDGTSALEVAFAALRSASFVLGKAAF